jgi:hypothetical protein
MTMSAFVSDMIIVIEWKYPVNPDSILKHISMSPTPTSGDRILTRLVIVVHDGSAATRRLNWKIKRDHY